MARTASVTIEDLPKVRKRLGNLTQQQFADRLNAMAPGLATTQQAVARWEAGRKIHPATAALIRLLDEQAAQT